MGLQRDGLAKGLGYGIPMRSDMADVALRQPQAQDGGQAEGKDKERGEGDGHLGVMQRSEL
jgi:hypothetical protein